MFTSANQIQGGSYDAAGNQTVMGAYSLTYDAENWIVHVTQGQSSGGGAEDILYDGVGRRVEKKVDGGPQRVYVYDVFGTLAAEYSSAAAPSTVCGTCYLSQDHLGSTRLVTNEAGETVARHDYVPFGEEIDAGVAERRSEWGPLADNVTQKFTGQERDSEMQLDFFQARYYSAAQARFNSPDPMNAGANPFDPQSWNGYAYVRNNPLALTDSSGMDPCKYGEDADDCVYGGDPEPVSIDPCWYCGYIQGNSDRGSSEQPQQPLRARVYRVFITPQANPAKKNQTFHQCMAANASNFSLIGGVDRIFGTSFSHTWMGGLLGGNSITGFMYGSADDNTQTAINNYPEILTRSMGKVTTYGRRTSTIMSLNLAGKGGLPRALGSSGTTARGAIGTAGKILGLGLSFEKGLQLMQHLRLPKLLIALQSHSRCRMHEIKKTISFARLGSILLLFACLGLVGGASFASLEMVRTRPLVGLCSELDFWLPLGPSTGGDGFFRGVLV